MTKIYELFGMTNDSRTGPKSNNLVDSDVFCGIELELEDVGGLSEKHSMLRDNFWRWTDEPSLRGYCCELVTGLSDGTPIRGKDLESAIESIRTAQEYLTRRGQMPSLSRRTSTHVHVDVTGLTTEEFRKFILLYIMTEEVIFKRLAEGRRGNNYCVPISDAEDLKDFLRKAFSGEVVDHGALDEMCSRWPKYTSLNLSPVRHIGSVEFRLFNGCFDADTLYQIVNTLLSLRQAACDKSIILKDLPLEISGNGFQHVINRIFTDPGASGAVGQVDDSTLVGARLVQEILRGVIQSTPAPSSANGKSKLYERFLKKHASGEL